MRNCHNIILLEIIKIFELADMNHSERWNIVRYNHIENWPIVRIQSERWKRGRHNLNESWQIVRFHSERWKFAYKLAYFNQSERWKFVSYIVLSKVGQLSDFVMKDHELANTIHSERCKFVRYFNSERSQIGCSER